MFEMRFVSRVVLGVGVCMALTPAAFSLGPIAESRLFPVTRGTEVLQPQNVPDGVSFYVRFRKVRQCEFVGLVWYHGERRLPVDFEPDAEQMPVTRPRGDQFSGPWFVRGLRSLSGSRAYAFHRCHPLWMTITRFYTGARGE